MTRHRHTLRSIAVPLVLALATAACGSDDSNDGADNADPGDQGTAAEEPSEEAPLDDVTLTMGGSAASSSVFAFITAHSRLAGDADGAMSINVRETGASIENVQLVADGAVDFGLSALSVLIQAQRGLGAFEGDAFPNMCNMLNYLINGEFMVVRDDIDSVYDLDGKAFAPGFQGSATFDNHMAYLEALGIEVDVFDGSLEDVVNAMKDGRIVGFAKSANGFTADATMLDVKSAVPVKVIGFSAEDVETIMAADPINPVLYNFTEIDAGSIFDNDQTYVSSILASYFTSTDTMDDDIQYRSTKAFWESIDEAAGQTNYDGSTGRTIAETLETADIMPICPGSQRYYDEAG